jgi:hypothetical protein
MRATFFACHETKVRLKGAVFSVGCPVFVNFADLVCEMLETAPAFHTFTRNYV